MYKSRTLLIASFGKGGSENFDCFGVKFVFLTKELLKKMKVTTIQFFRFLIATAFLVRSKIQKKSVYLTTLHCTYASYPSGLYRCQ